MKLVFNFLLILLFGPLLSKAQFTIIKDVGSVKKTINLNSNGFIYFYFNADNENLVNTTFGIKDKRSLDIINYANCNFNLLSKNNEVGRLYFSDTIKYPNQINYSIINELVGQILNNSITRNFKENNLGLYYFDAKIYFSYGNTEDLNYKLFIKNDELILECDQKMNFFTYEHQAYDGSEKEIDFYNSPEIGKIANGTNNELRFRRDKAFKQLSNIAIFNDVRGKIKQYFEQYLNEINDQIITLKL